MRLCVAKGVRGESKASINAISALYALKQRKRDEKKATGDTDAWIWNEGGREAGRQGGREAGRQAGSEAAWQRGRQAADAW
jgi:hypothetical protein